MHKIIYFSNVFKVIIGSLWNVFKILMKTSYTHGVIITYEIIIK